MLWIESSARTQTILDALIVDALMAQIEDPPVWRPHAQRSDSTSAVGLIDLGSDMRGDGPAHEVVVRPPAVVHHLEETTGLRLGAKQRDCGALGHWVGA